MLSLRRIAESNSLLERVAEEVVIWYSDEMNELRTVIKKNREEKRRNDNKGRIEKDEGKS